MTATADVPLVSVVMPVRDEEGFIGRALESVLDQDHPAVEVIVVDGCSDDGTVAEVEEVAARRGRPEQVRVVENRQRTVPTALNRGIAAARGEVVLRVDGHCELSPGYIARCVAVLAEGTVDCVGGVLRSVGHGATGRAVAAAQSSPFGAGDAAFRVGAAVAGPVDTLAFGAYRRDVFDRVGPFDPELVRNQDDELNLRLTRHGGVIWLDPTISATYHTRARLRGVARQYFQYGLFKVRVAQKHHTVSTARQLVPAALVLALVGGGVLAARGRPAPLGALGGTYAAATTAAAVRAGGGDPAVTVRLPVVYAAMHLAYGTGYLGGLAYWTVGRRRSRDWRLSR